MEIQPVRFPAAGPAAPMPAAPMPAPPMLEGELWLPDGAAPSPAVVVTHMNSLRGGSMAGNTVAAMCEGIQAAGIGWLRVNFRGVGKSEGEYTDGVGEVQDVLGALTWLGAQDRVDAAALGLAGHSFGARVSLMAQAAKPPITALFLVAPPLPEPLPVERHPVCSYLVVIGDADANLTDGAETYASHLPDPDRVRFVPGIDHLWRGSEQILANETRAFFAEAFAPRPSSRATRS